MTCLYAGLNRWTVKEVIKGVDLTGKHITPYAGKPFIDVSVLAGKDKSSCGCCRKLYKAVYVIRLGTHNSSTAYSDCTAYKLCDACFHRLLLKMYHKSKYTLDLAVNSVKTGTGK